MNTELSPLDQIRKVEAEVTRQVAAAQEKTKQIIAQARRDAKERIKKAKEEGYKLGQARGEEILAKTEEEVKSILEHAQRQADVYRSRGQEQMDAAVRYAVEFVLGFEGENKEI